MEKEAEEVTKEWQALFESKNIHDGFNVWVGWIEPDMPVFVSSLGAKSEADYYRQGEKNIKRRGEHTWRYRRNQWIFAENLR